MSQGFSTMYDMKILNNNLLSKIVVTTGKGTPGTTSENPVYTKSVSSGS